MLNWFEKGFSLYELPLRNALQLSEREKLDIKIEYKNGTFGNQSI